MRAGGGGGGIRTAKVDEVAKEEAEVGECSGLCGVKSLLQQYVKKKKEKKKGNRLTKE